MDAFNKNLLMMNFIFYKDDDYPSSHTSILQFMLLKLLNKIKETINNLLPTKIAALGNFLVKAKGQPQFKIIILQWNCFTPILK